MRPVVRKRISASYGAGGKSIRKKAQERIITQVRRGSIQGENRTLTTEQEKKPQKTVLAHYPDPLQCDCALWTHEAVRQLLKRESSIAMQYGPWQHSLPDGIHTANTGYRVHMNELPRR